MPRNPDSYGAMLAVGAVKKLRRSYGMTQAEAERTVRVAYEHGVSCQPFGDDMEPVTVLRRNVPKLSQKPMFEVFPGLPEISEKVSRKTTPGARDRRYTSGVTRDQAGWDEHMSRRSSKPSAQTKEKIMAPRKPATKEAEPEEVETEPDLSLYLEKTITPKMQDYVTFVIDEVFGGDEKAFDECPADRILYLGPTVYHFFQASAFNKERTAERRAAKSAGNGAEDSEAEAEEAPAKPARGRKPAAAKPAAAKPAGKPAGRTRGRTKPAASTESAPY